MSDPSKKAAAELSALIDELLAIIRDVDSDTRKLYRIDRRLAETEAALERRDLVRRRR